jgi:folate-binding Fe-S cluster repair protein YgfZ
MAKRYFEDSDGRWAIDLEKVTSIRYDPPNYVVRISGQDSPVFIHLSIANDICKRWREYLDDEVVR